MEISFNVLSFVICLTCLLSISSGMILTSRGKILCPGQTLPLITAYRTESFPSPTSCFTGCFASDICLAVSYRKSDRSCYFFNTLADDDCYGLVSDSSVKFITKTYPYTCFNGGIKEVNTGRPCKCVNDYVDTWCQRRMRDCDDEGNYGYYNVNRFYTLKPRTATTTFTVLCYLSGASKLTLIAFHGRDTPNGYFNKSWGEMKTDFSIGYTSIWSGLEILHHLSFNRKYRLQIFVRTAENAYVYSNTKYFNDYFTNVRVANESENYRISFSSVELDAGLAGLGGSVTFMNNSEFTTYDRDNDQHPGLNCAVDYEAPFWFKDCGESNPLGAARKPTNLLEKPKRMFFDGIEGAGILPYDVQIYLRK